MFTNCGEDEDTNYNLTVEVSPTEGGTVSYQNGPFQRGTKVTLTASANANFVFKEWTGAFNGTINPIELIMNANNTVTAVFEYLDLDNDGVQDNVDNCLDTPTGETVDANGCSDSQKDTDGDGVDDNRDYCPDTPSGETVDGSGCALSQKDVDGDGVYDDIDACVNTLAGATVDANGCADTDQDGILNNLDTCADTPTGETVDVNGCADSQKDTDGDGVTDDIDLCENSNLVVEINNSGCYVEALYIDSNGVTIKANEKAVAGKKYKFNDTIYLVVDDDLFWNFALRGGEELEQLIVTTLVTDMSRTNTQGTMLDVGAGSWKNHWNDPQLKTWDVSNVTKMTGLFRMATSFNQDISNWDVSSVSDPDDMFDMFWGASSFNQDIGSWDVSNVKNMARMFHRAHSFNQDISGWDVGNVERMYMMFSGWDGDFPSPPSQFNQDISSWDVSNVIAMSSMFYMNDSINQDLSSWDVSNVTNCGGFSLKTPNWTLPKPNFTNCVD